MIQILTIFTFKKEYNRKQYIYRYNKGIQSFRGLHKNVLVWIVWKKAESVNASSTSMDDFLFTITRFNIFISNLMIFGIKGFLLLVICHVMIWWSYGISWSVGLLYFDDNIYSNISMRGNYTKISCPNHIFLCSTILKAARLCDLPHYIHHLEPTDSTILTPCF